MVESSEPKNILGKDKCIVTRNNQAYEEGTVILTSGKKPCFHFYLPTTNLVVSAKSIVWQDKEYGTSIVVQEIDNQICFYLQNTKQHKKWLGFLRGTSGRKFEAKNTHVLFKKEDLSRYYDLLPSFKDSEFCHNNKLKRKSDGQFF